jgi:elongation factor P--(R)-beta-lysine ligase
LKRTPLAELPQHEFGARVCVAGRLVQLHEREALLQDESGTARISGGAEVPPPGSLVQLSARWRAPGLLDEALFSDVQTASGDFAAAGAEFVELQRRAGRLRQRAALSKRVREFFDARGFLEIETPLVVPSPGLDLHLSALPVQTRAGERYLITSPEYQMKRLLAGGFERIYQIAKCFRDDELGERHQPEFSMLEWYRGFAGVEQVMRDTEELVAQVALTLGERPILHTARGDIDVTPPWPRISVREAFRRFAGLDLDEVLGDEERFYRLLIEQIEPRIGELGAVFLHEYPASMASLARKKPSDPSVAERFEAYVAGIELCNGFGELTCPAEQRARLLTDQRARAERGLPVYPLDERFLSALEQGMPPSAGNALGLDRLWMLALGADHIEDVIAIGASRL